MKKGKKGTGPQNVVNGGFSDRGNHHWCVGDGRNNSINGSFGAG